MPLISTSMEAGLAALHQGQDQEAIQIFETFCQNAVPDSREHLQAQMHLVKTYQNLGENERAIGLCQALLECANAQVQIWAQQTMKGLGGVEEVKESEEVEEAEEAVSVEQI
jgi:lipopolysaccharide biosynthesis regulator YciM